MEKRTGILIDLGMTPVSMVLSGYTLSVLWSWFIVPKFALLPLTIPEALGLALMIEYFTLNLAKTDWNLDTDAKKALFRIVMPFTRAAVFLGFGWIYRQFL